MIKLLKSSKLFSVGFTLKMLITVAAKYYTGFVFVFARENKAGYFIAIVCQTIHMKCQVLFSMKKIY